MADQTIRVSARGDFGQLQRGLKQLQGDLKTVIGEIDKGARKGGFFDQSQIRALDFFKQRFVSSFGAMNNEIRKQDEVLRTMYENMKKSSGDQQRALQKEIDKRSEVVESLRDQAAEMQRIYNLNLKHSQQFKTAGRGGFFGGGGGSSSGGGGGGSKIASAGASLGSSLFGGMKMLLGMAGLGGLATIASQSYQLGYAKSTNTLDLAQRLRTRNGIYTEGSNTAMYDRIGAVGMSDNMGYGKQESYQFMDTLSRQAGYVGGGDQAHLMKFGRAYGLQSSEVAGLSGANFAAGGGSLAGVTDAIAGSVAKSGMTPRIVEVMEANNGLLKQMNTTLKDGSATTLLAYQTTLDKIGNANGMHQLTGANGANIIGGLGGIFGSDTSSPWKMMGMRALMSYNPKKYGNMDLFNLESSFEDGLMNTDNVPAMLQHINKQTGGNAELNKRVLQKWLQDGGYAATKRQVSEFYDVTDGGKAVTPAQIEALKNGSIDSGAKYDNERAGLAGQNYLQTDARFDAALESIGEKYLVPVVQTVKEAAAGGLEALIKATDGMKSSFSDIFKGAGVDLFGGMLKGINDIYTFLKDHWTAIDKAGEYIKGLGDMISNIWGKGKTFDSFVKYGAHPEDVAKANFQAIHGGKAPDWITDPSQLDMKNKNYYRNDPRWKDTPQAKAEEALDKMTEVQKKEALLSGQLDEKRTTITAEGVADMQSYMESLMNNGGASIEQLQKDGTKSYKDMFDTTDDKMQKILDEHRTFLGSFKDRASDIIPSIKSLGSFGNLTSLAESVITKNEGNYGTVVRNDGGALSIGKMQWHAGRAKGLLNNIVQKDALTGIGSLGIDLYNKVTGKDNFSNFIPTADESERIQKLLNTDVGKQAQDELAQTDINGYLARGKALGINDPKALAYFADLYNQSPAQAENIVGAAANRDSLTSLYNTSLNNSVMGKYAPRRQQAYQEILASKFTGDGTGPEVYGPATPLDSKISVELQVTGDGANALNQATYGSLKEMITRTIQEVQRNKLLTNPSIPGR